MEEFRKNDEDDFEDEDFLEPKHQEHQSHHSGQGAVQGHKPAVHHGSAAHHEHHQKPKSKTTYNLWQVVSGVLAVVLIVVMYIGFFNNGGVSKEDAADKNLNFVN